MASYYNKNCIYDIKLLSHKLTQTKHEPYSLPINLLLKDFNHIN